MNPVKIKIENKKDLYIKWDDDSESRINLKYLRDECPCANCKGETVLLKTYKPAKLTVERPGMYEIKNIEQVGGYAIQVTWKDGHNTGFYTYEYLKQLDKDQGNDQKHDYENIL